MWGVDNPTLEFTSDGVISYYDPMVFQLVRTSGIIEHEIIVEGTNYLESLEIESPDYLREMRDFVTNKLQQSTIPIPGYDYGGASNSLSVIQNFGHNGMEEPENDWTTAVKMTPGGRNIGQVIDPNHPVPAGEEILVYFTVTGDHITQSLDGSNFTNGMFSAIVTKGNPIGTNVVYRVDPWYVLGSVRTGTVSLIDKAVQTKAMQPYEYTLSNVAKGISNNVTVVASAALNPKFGADWGVPEDDPYRDAIIDWLEGGKDLYGNPFADVESGEIKLATHRSWWSGAVMTNLTLREMYWLDMDPTIGNLSLIGGITIDPHGIEHVVSQTIGESSVVLTNRRVNVYMMISNENETVAAPLHQRGAHDFTTHWTPYVLRGLKPARPEAGRELALLRVCDGRLGQRHVQGHGHAHERLHVVRKHRQQGSLEAFRVQRELVQRGRAFEDRGLRPVFAALARLQRRLEALVGQAWLLPRRILLDDRHETSASWRGAVEGGQLLWRLTK